jgi:hypothetical protein
MPLRRTVPVPRPTAELFRGRRHALVDAAWHVGFVLTFAAAGIPAFRVFLEPGSRSLAGSFSVYVALLFAAGLVGGIVGAAIGHVCASIWERIDLQRHPRSYEDRPRVTDVAAGRRMEYRRGGRRLPYDPPAAERYPLDGIPDRS